MWHVLGDFDNILVEAISNSMGIEQVCSWCTSYIWICTTIDSAQALSRTEYHKEDEVAWRAEIWSFPYSIIVRLKPYALHGHGILGSDLSCVVYMHLLPRTRKTYTQDCRVNSGCWSQLAADSVTLDFPSNVLMIFEHLQFKMLMALFHWQQ